MEEEMTGNPLPGQDEFQTESEEETTTPWQDNETREYQPEMEGAETEEDFDGEDLNYQYQPENEEDAMLWGNNNYTEYMGEYQPEFQETYDTTPWRGDFVYEEEEGEGSEQQQLAGMVKETQPIVCGCKKKKNGDEGKPSIPLKAGIQHGLGNLLDEMIQAVLTYQPEEDDIYHFLSLYMKERVRERGAHNDGKQSLFRSQTLAPGRSSKGHPNQRRFSHREYKYSDNGKWPSMATDEEAAKRLKSLLRDHEKRSADEGEYEYLGEAEGDHFDLDGGKSLQNIHHQKRLSADADEDGSVEDLIQYPEPGSIDADAHDSSEDVQNQNEKKISAATEEGADGGLEDDQNQRKLSTSVDEDAEKIWQCLKTHNDLKVGG